MKTRVRRLLGSLLGAILLSMLGINVVQAQTIVPDADTQTIIASPNHNPHQVDITGGTRSGSNLFHSFQQFGVSAGQIANFLSQPTIQNILGRITGGHVSRLNGLIQVTGGNSNLFLMNPAGIIFGAQARLNVPAAFVATTANGIRIGNGWFNAIGNNNYANLTGNPESFAFLSHAGAILNAGMLTAQPGQRITLLGGVVVNTGTISAPSGTITIAAVPGQRLVRITQDGSVLSLLLPTETANAINAPTSTPLSLAALLTGGGLPEATGITVENGTVRLTSTGTVVATDAGTTTVSGTVSAAATTSPNPSKIQVFGDRISLQTATLDASGMNGGTVRIGGDYQGSGTLPQARVTEVDANSIVRADAIAEVPGNGGSVVIWSTDTTQIAGTITAQGSHYGGNGGLVETSSQHTLLVSPTTRVRTDAPQGQTGTWLLDPPELTVTADGAATIAGAPLTNTPTTATTISATAIVTGLNGNNVNLQASDRITVNAAIEASANPVAGNLTLTTPTTTLNQPISLAPGSILSGTATTVNVNPGARIQNGIDVAVSGGTVNVAAGTFYLPGVTNQVSITKPLTMQGAGAGNTIVDGGGNSRVFYVDPGVGNTVNLDSLTVQNGYVVGDGAGILVNSGTLNLANSTLSRNSATNGGGIHNDSTVNLTNSTLIGNSATNDGGGIYNRSTLNLTNSSITSNSATNGGGIFNGGKSYYRYPGNPDSLPYYYYDYYYSYNLPYYRYDGGIVSIINSTLTGNLAINGGAIYNDSRFDSFSSYGSSFSAGTINLMNSTLTENLASNLGGGIYNSGFMSYIPYLLEVRVSVYGIVNLTDSSLSGNVATKGGGIFNSGRANLSNSTITQNLASNFGGGVYNDGWAILTNSTVTRNLATESGGGIYNSRTINLTNSTVSYNSSSNGGGIYNSGYYDWMFTDRYGLVNVTNSTFNNNLATNGSGGGIYNYHGWVDLTNSTLSSNSATDFGGGIYSDTNYYEGAVRTRSSTITNNSAYSGGGIFNTAKTEYNWWYNWFYGFSNKFIVRSSIIAGNVAFSGRELISLGNGQSEGYNLFGFNSSSGVEGMALSTTDIVPSVAMAYILTPLGNYSGLTQTHALLPDNPAIDAGDPSLTTPDQRGLARVSRADIGAVEFRRADVDAFNLRVPVSPPLPSPPSPAPPSSTPSPSASFTLPTFNPDDLNQLSAALAGREIESMTISIQPMPTESILCVDRSPTEAEDPDLYQGIPDCPE